MKQRIGIFKLAVGIVIGVLGTVLEAYADGSFSGDSLRSKRWEVLLAPQFTLSKNLGFDGGTTAKINDTWGFGLQVGYNFNEHWNLGGLFSWSNPGYQAVVQPAAGNPSLPRPISGSIETTTFALAATYNVLAGPLTPYIDTNIGGTYVNTDIAAGPPVAGCF
jgi:opacity protein-like surface antigen